MIVHLPLKRRQFLYPTDVIPGIKRVDAMNILRVTEPILGYLGNGAK